MWRPEEGWENPYDCSVCDTEPEGCPGCGSDAYEAGADAMLKAAIEWLEGYCGHREEPTLRIDCHKCWQVFTGEKEVDKNND